MRAVEGVLHVGRIDVGGLKVEGRWEPGSHNVWMVVDDGTGCGLRDLGYANLQDEGRLVLFPHFGELAKNETTRTLLLSAARRWLNLGRTQMGM